MDSLNNPHYNPSIKPKTVICYICGREYGTKSLPIHIKTCEQKFLAEQAQKPKNQRKPLPEPPKQLGQMSQSELDEYNQKAFTTYNNVALDKCSFCGRTFNPESLVVHQRVCTYEKPFKKLPGYTPTQKTSNGTQSQVQDNSNPMPVRPKSLVCYICGREYGTKSLGIHLKTCKQNYQQEQEQRHPSQRKPLPSTPRGLHELLSKENITYQDIMDYNCGVLPLFILTLMEAFAKYNEEALVACNTCGRTFKYESLLHHQKQCAKNNPISEECQSEELVACSKCGRKFHGSRVEKHENVCKGQKKVEAEPVRSKWEDRQAENKIDGNKSIRCYVCFQQHAHEDIAQHVEGCGQERGFQGEVPALFRDIVKISDPSEYLIDMYHQSLNQSQMVRM